METSMMGANCYDIATGFIGDHLAKIANKHSLTAGNPGKVVSFGLRDAVLP